MSRISYKQLRKMSVETVSGAALGKLSDLVLETDGQLIAQYIVKPSITKPLSWKGAECLISRDQIVRVEKKKIIVSDNAAKQGEVKEQSEKKLGISPEPIAMSKENA